MPPPPRPPATRQKGTTGAFSEKAPAPGPDRRCRPRQKAFLRVYRATLSVGTAARASNIGRRHYHWLEQDPAYQSAFTALRQEIFDELHDQAVQRAVQGWLEPVVYKGVTCGSVRRYSDRLLMFLLQLDMPEKYGPPRRVRRPRP